MNFDAHKCKHCGGELYHGRCLECGRTDSSGTASSDDYVPSHQSSVMSNSPELRQLLVNQNEEVIATLGNSYFQNFISKGEITKAFSVITDKRVYLKGSALTKQPNGSFVYSNLSKNVDLKDVTGISTTAHSAPAVMAMAVIAAIFAIGMFISGFVNNADSGSYYIGFNQYGQAENRWHTFDPSWFIWGAIGLAAAILFYVLYRISKTNILQIEFAGGIIAFDCKFYSYAECECFQKRLRQAKDNAIEQAEQASARAMQATVSQIVSQNNAQVAQSTESSVNELMKYAELFEKGLITETEFSEVKAKLLSK